MTTPAAPTAPLQHDSNGVRDFTVRRPPVEFRIDDDVFHAPNVIAPVKLRALAAAAGNINVTPEVMAGDGFDTLLGDIAGLFRTLIGGVDGKLFADRLLSTGLKRGDQRPDGEIQDQDELAPIDLLGQAIPVLWFLMESYGMRPTMPSSPSLTGSTDGVQDMVGDGTSSTDGASPSV